MKKKIFFLSLSFLATFLLPFQKNSFAAEIKGDPHQARGWEVPPPKTEPEDYWLFLPRFDLAIPRYLFTGLFYPIIEVGAWVEREAIVEHVIDFLYNDARTAAILPTATFSPEYGHLVGARAFHRDLFENKERIEFEASYGSPHRQLYKLFFKGDRVGGSPIWIDSEVAFVSQTSLRFSGIGNNGEEIRVGQDPRDSNVLTRYSREINRAKLGFGYGFGERKPTYKVGTSFIFQKHEIFEERRSKHDDSSIEAVYDRARLFGFEEDLELLEILAHFKLNLLNQQGQPSRGSTLDLFFGGVPEFREDISYLHYGFEHDLYLNLYRDNRVLLLRTLLESVEGKDEKIPFFSYPSLGGADRLRGYYQGTFRDKHAGSLGVEYHYPIHQYVVGQLFFDLGTVSEKYSELGRHWHPGGGFGFLFGTKDKLRVKLDASFGENESVFFATLNIDGAFLEEY